MKVWYDFVLLALFYCLSPYLVVCGFSRDIRVVDVFFCCL
jgi:hypothetical protein